LKKERNKSKISSSEDSLKRESPVRNRTESPVKLDHSEYTDLNERESPSKLS
jgi:hypothetical protein